MNDKAQLRRQARDVRACFASHHAQECAHRARDRFREALSVPSSVIVAGYWPIGDEIDPRPLLQWLEDQQGVTLALPVVENHAAPLIFRRWRWGEALIEGAYGALTPAPTAENVSPDWVIVPLLAVDKRGTRLGYGGGYYDRTLCALRREKPVLAIGLAYECQKVAHVPCDDTDQPLDWLITEASAIDFHQET